MHETDVQVSEALVHSELIDYFRRELPVSRTPERTELEALSDSGLGGRGGAPELAGLGDRGSLRCQIVPRLATNDPQTNDIVGKRRLMCEG